MAKKNNYNEDQIRVLEGLEAVRVRPDMYIGSRDKKGLHHLVWEIVDNSVDEYMAGFCNEINVTIHENNSITVKDNGRGIPVGMHKTQKKPTLEVVLTVLHAGGKFGGDSPYKTSGGLHGVGSSCVNALSTHMIATVVRDGKIHEIEFSEGKTIKPLSTIGKAPKNDSGTTIWFQPDHTIFKETLEYDFQVIYNRLRESAFLNKGLKITLTDERVIEDDNSFHNVQFYYENGIKDFIEHLNKKRTPILKEIFYISDMQEDISIESAFQYTTDYSEYIVSFANNIKTPGGGTHETGFKSAVASVLKKIIDEKDLVKDPEEPLISDDIRVGLVSIVSVKVPEPQFEGQTKGKLSNAEVRTVVQRLVQQQFSKFLYDNPKLIKPILDKVMQSYEERVSLKKARLAIRKQNKKEDSSFSLPDKLVDCRRTTPVEQCELFIVEGDSAGGSAKGGRDNVFQAVLPLRGKILNVQNMELKRILENAEISNIISAIGTGVGEEFDYEQRRYEKIILMTDADVDGSHIAVLLLTFIYKYMRPLIDNGNVYLAQPPLFGLKRGTKILKFVSSEEELVTAKIQFPNAMVQRYKGLGEMNKTELKVTTMDPGTRTLVRATIEDAHLVSELFESLMGDSPIERKRFIEENSHKADIDI